MSHTIVKHPSFKHRTEGQQETGIEGIDDFVSLEKIETLLNVLRDYSSLVVQENSRSNFAVLLDTAIDEAKDIKCRLLFKQAQKNQQSSFN